jgi:hypothetical protein
VVFFFYPGKKKGVTTASSLPNNNNNSMETVPSDGKVVSVLGITYNCVAPKYACRMESGRELLLDAATIMALPGFDELNPKPEWASNKRARADEPSVLVPRLIIPEGFTHSSLPILVAEETPNDDNEQSDLLVCYTKQEHDFFKALAERNAAKQKPKPSKETLAHFEHLYAYFNNFLQVQSRKRDCERILFVSAQTFDLDKEDKHVETCEACRALVPTQEKDGKKLYCFPTLQFTSREEQNGKASISFFVYAGMC